MAERNDRLLILASGSPRRRELLAKMGYTFETCSPGVDEHAEGHPRDVVVTLAQRKANAASEHHHSGIIIASDTLVSLDGVPLGKPADEEDAKRMLRNLSDREHEVFTGVCLLDADTGKYEVRSVRTGVAFRAITESEIEEYVATGEPMDKAGAYAIQGGAGKFVEKLDGELENVIGFPVVEVREMLGHFGM